MNNDYLVHHGILGQKWGVRRYQNKDGSLTNAGKKRLAELEAEKAELEKGIKPKESPTEQLSNADLRAIIERKRLEDDYSKLFATTPAQVKKGKSKVGQFTGWLAKDLIVPAATDIGRQYVKGLMADFVNKTGKLEGDRKVYANNNKKK